MTAPRPAPGLSPSPPSASERWRHIPLGWRVVLVVVAAVVAAQLASSTFSGLSSPSSGASGPSSSYDSSASGTGALAQLLADRGHGVHRVTVPLGSASVPVDSTVLVLDPRSWTPSDTHALERAMAAGDRVVLGGRSPAPGVLRSLGIVSPPRWQPTPAGATHPVARLPEVRGVRTVVAAGAGTFAATASGALEPAPLLSGPGGVLAVVTPGRGSLVLLASSSPLRNGALGQADNAAFALDLVPARSTVVFDEYDHGFGRAGSGLAGLPASWRWGLAFVLLSVVVWVVSAARRFGPPDAPSRITVPARVRYVDAMATLLSTRPPDQVLDAVAPVVTEARRRLCRRLALPPDASDAVVADRLSRGGEVTNLPPGLADVVLRPLRSADDVVAVGTALSGLEREDRNR